MNLIAKLLFPISKEHLDGHVIIAIPSSVNPANFIVNEEIGKGDSAKLNCLGYMGMAKFQDVLSIVGGKQSRTVNNAGCIRVEIEFD